MKKLLYIALSPLLLLRLFRQSDQQRHLRARHRPVSDREMVQNRMQRLYWTKGMPNRSSTRRR